MNQASNQELTDTQRETPSIYESELQELKLSDDEREKRHKIVDKLVLYAISLRQTSSSCIHDESAKISSWKQYHEASGEWTFTMLHETNHLMIECRSQKGKQRFYCIDGHKNNLWGADITEDYEQVPLFIPTDELKDIRGTLRNMHSKAAGIER